MSGVNRKKVGMTSISMKREKYSCKLSKVGFHCVGYQVRTFRGDGYSALQLGFDDKAGKTLLKQGRKQVIF